MGAQTNTYQYDFGRNLGIAHEPRFAEIAALIKMATSSGSISESASINAISSADS
jgi:hypothetical protein